MGLSPRVRGNLLPPMYAVITPGSIPACAGEPEKRFMFEMTIRVYPRVCGGTYTVKPRVRAGRGLSPRVRGNPSRRAAGRPSSRSIPACAGEPSLRPRRVCVERVYPRVCGGTSIGTRPSHFCLGLSPRVRGNQSRQLPPTR